MSIGWACLNPAWAGCKIPILVIHKYDSTASCQSNISPAPPSAPFLSLCTVASGLPMITIINFPRGVKNTIIRLSLSDNVSTAGDIEKFMSDIVSQVGDIGIKVKFNE